MTDLAEDLTAQLAGQYEEPEDTVGRAAFRFDNDSKATWGLRELGKLRARQAEITRLADEQRELIADWEKRQLKLLEDSAKFFESGLAEYLGQVLDAEMAPALAAGKTFDEAWDGLRRKSRELPGGTIKAARERRSVVIEDTSSFVAWARENGHESLLSTPEPVPSKKAILHAPTVDGHVIYDGEKAPGVRIEDPGVRFTAVPKA